MKVYLDELPKSCAECFCRFDDTWCGLSDGEIGPICEECRNKTRHEKCPLKTLAEHDKQVRKEVCEDIKKKVLEYFNVKNEEEYENSLSLLDALFTADVVFEILDKIGGEEC